MYSLQSTEVSRLWVLLVLLLSTPMYWEVDAISFKDQMGMFGDLKPPQLNKPHLGVKGSDRTFKIAIMADLHYGETAWTSWGPHQDVKSSRVQDFILDAEKPDLVIYLGDQVTANNIVAANASKYWVQSMYPASRRSIPHASVYGNHDDAFTVYEDDWFGPSGIPGLPAFDVGYYHSTTREDLTKEEMGMPTSVSRPGPEGLWPSMSNFVLTVGSGRSPGTAAALLYLLDSGGGSYPEIISASQAAWFKATATEVNPAGSIPELIFFHIPTKAHAKVGPSPKSAIEHPCVGSINEEEVASQVQEKGLMDVLTKRKAVKAVFTGHNHGLDWCCPHQSLWLCFARHTGYGGYGSWTRGARILLLAEEPEFSLKSWIKLENGEVVADIDLV
ncbi:hypothetical protein R1flu_006052 [Riccia fluitans]|uniref:Calcineurin-like phosphoesterase domain-containing protein n=1 Tax=Riccia fluitans TaxID=41844 RepID=A0ABD1YV61_9MARC